MTQKQVEAFGIWFTRINHLVHGLRDCSICMRYKHDQFLHATPLPGQRYVQGTAEKGLKAESEENLT